MYDHSKQYRCTIIRGKSQSEIDDLLPAYASVLDSICPCSIQEFPSLFNERLAIYLSENKRKKKTLDNHRTEIAGKLFGMYYVQDEYVYISERTLKFIEDTDQPAFFKDVCYKFQVPNGMQKTATVLTRIKDNLSLRPNAFVLKVLDYAKNAGIRLSKKDIGYYVLNSLDVLSGKASPLEVIECILEDKKNGISRLIKTEGKASSYDYQHINEQLNYLELANLIRTDSDGTISLNILEQKTIDVFIESLNLPLFFSFSNYDISNKQSVSAMHTDWDFYYSKLSDASNEFSTSLESLGILTEPTLEQKVKKGESTIELGDEGEIYVFNYEKDRVSKVNKRLANKVIALGKTKGIGYDIQSVIAEPGDRLEFVKYIEVKSTRRVTAPNLQDTEWCESINITRNEWVAAQQHKEFYSIYRVYFVRDNVLIHVIEDVNQKYSDGKISVTPMMYRVDYGSEAIDRVLGEKSNA